MPDILHRISIDAPQERVYDLIATTEGVARWWTGRQVSGEAQWGADSASTSGTPIKPPRSWR